MSLLDDLRATLADAPPLPGHGQTARRHALLFELGRRDLSLARLAEAHWDAVAILAEAGATAVPGTIYGVWAAEMPGKAVRFDDGALRGTKPFCSGAGLIDRALVTVTQPSRQLVDVDLRDPHLTFDDSAWQTQAFSETKTSMITFDGVSVSPENIVGPEDFYLSRPGFWHGACGPACCWAGGAAGLVDWAMKQTRSDPHTVAHLGAMSADLWALQSILRVAGDEIDAAPADIGAAQRRALTVRHLVETHASDILRRLPRAYGPHPLAFDRAISTRYQELDLYLRQCHAERDLQALGCMTLESAQDSSMG